MIVSVGVESAIGFQLRLPQTGPSFCERSEPDSNPEGVPAFSSGSRGLSGLTSDGKPDSRVYMMARQAHFIEIEIDTETGEIKFENEDEPLVIYLGGWGNDPRSEAPMLQEIAAVADDLEQRYFTTDEH